MRPAARHVALALTTAAVAVAGCAGPPPEPAPARLEVELLRGARAGTLDAPPPAPLHVVVTSPGPADDAERTARWAWRRRAADRWLATLASEDEVVFFEPDPMAAPGCAPPRRTVARAPGFLPPELAGQLPEAAPVASYGLGAALEATAATTVDLDDGRAPPRIVVFGAGAPACGPDPCAAAARLLAAGAQLELVLPPAEEAPACLAEAAAGPVARVGAALAPPTAAVPFRVELLGGAAARAGGGLVVAWGEAGPAPEVVSVMPGPARLVVGLDPPLVVEPLALAPGTHLRVRVLEFPALSPPVREVQVESVAPPPSPAAAVPAGEGAR